MSGNTTTRRLPVHRNFVLTIMEFQDTVEIGVRLQQAMAAHQQGQIAQARASYEEILRLQPRHFEALHMLGIIACQTRNPQRGIEFLSQALSVNPAHAAAHCNLGNAYKAIGRVDDALASYDRALAIAPDFAEAHYNRGNVLKDLRRLEEALASYDSAIACKPELPEVHSNRGIVLTDLDRPLDALASHDRAIQLKPAHAPAHSNRGNALLRLGRLDEALDSYDRAIALRPDFAEAYVNRGNALAEMGRFDQALTSFVQAFRIDADLVGGLNNFSALMRHVKPPAASDEIKKLVIRCLENSAVESEAVAGASTALLLRDLQELMRAGTRTLPDVIELDRLTGGLLIAHLRYCPIVDRRLEEFLARVRRQLLLAPDNAGGASLERHPESDFLIALARQGFLNEHLWRVSGPEEEKLARLEGMIAGSISANGAPLRELLLLAAYRPLHAVREIRSWCMNSLEHFPPKLRAAFSFLVVNPIEESRLEADIESLTAIEDAVSAAVQSQYEENPYPRWESLAVGKRVGYVRQILEEIAPHRPELRAVTNAPRVLIAGCGSGRHALSSALRLEGSSVLAVDLSRKSLAYARRKAMEMNVTNVRFAQADILNLAATGLRFDVIECSGVLHHMTDPGAGVEALLRVLIPGGYIKLGLYSRLARRHVLRLRELAAAAPPPVTRDDIRSLREALIDADTPEVHAIQQSPDFYTTSAVRDLLFHVHELQFSIGQVEDLISHARLEFLGFVFLDPRVKLAYAQRFRDDPSCINLRNWHLFESAYPDIFSNMYQFWCRKRASVP